MSFLFSRRRAMLTGCLAVVGAKGFAVENLTEDLFDAMDNNLVEAKFIPNNEKSAQVVLTNVSNRPLSLKLPSSFVGTPVLAQQFNRGPGFGGPGFGGQQGQGGMNQGTQVTGGGFGQGQGGMQNNGGFGFGRGGMGQGGMFGPGGAAFSIPPEQTRVLKASTVCLEYGKTTPYPGVKYSLQKVTSFSSDPVITYVLEMLGLGKVTQKVAQAAAWHVSDQMSWEELSSETISHIVGGNERFFSRMEISQAINLVEQAKYVTNNNYSR